MRNVTRTLKMLLSFVIATFVFVSFGFAQQTMLLTESFETGSGTTPPTGWALEQVTGSTMGVSFVSTSTYPTISAAYDGSVFVKYNSFSISSGSTRLKKTAPLVTTNKSFIMVDFAWYEDPAYSSSNDKVDVQWSTDGTTWNTAGTFLRFNATAGWKVKNVVLPTGASNQPALYVAFLFTSDYGNNCDMDLVHVTAGPPAPPAFATIGTGTISCSWPYITLWMGGRTQMLYTAAELTAAGVTPGNISSIGLNVISNSTQTMNGFYVKAGQTTSTSLTSWVNGLATYYNTPYAVPGTGWQDITLTTPFVWNGTSNVIFEICYANTSYTSNSSVYGTAVSNSTAYYYADVQTACSTTSYTITPNRPNIRLGVPPVTPGVLMGIISDVNTGLPLPGAIIQVGTKADTARANGFYIIYNLTPGTVNYSVSVAGYTTNTGSATIVGGVATTKDIQMLPGPKVEGHVYDASNGNPIVGALVNVGSITNAAITVAGGYYKSIGLDLADGTYPITINKTGYDLFTDNVVLVSNTTAVKDAQLLPTAVAPGPFTAALNNPTTPTAVNLNWGLPAGMYQLIYDDGIQDNFAIWATANNLNAMKFTGAGYPVKLVGGKVYLGTAANYPSNALPLNKFMMFVYKADGTGGVPGTIMDSVEVNPTGFGWVDFALATPITFTMGDFYLVMRQGGIPPHAAGLGVDETNPQLRSYSKFVSGGSPWIPASGNFMIRAIVQGTGGPMLADNSVNPDIINAVSVPGLTYAKPIAPVSGTEGVAKTEPIEWSSLNVNTVPMETGLTTYSGPASPKSDIGEGSTTFVGGVVAVPDATEATLYDNGPMVNSPGTGAGGADESMIQSPLNSFGMNFINGTYRIADDFAVSGGIWNVSSLEFYGYQSGSPTTSSFTGAYVRIFQGTPGGTVTTVWGDNTTNRLSSTTFSNIYRVSVTGNTSRPIMKIVVNTPGLTLQPGSYWIEFSATGSLASGPWCPPITINNQTTTGNALVYIESTSTYENYEIAAYQQGAPFKLFGTVTPIVSNLSYQVWRLLQGQEGNQALWNSIATITTNSTVDNSWPSLPNGPYRWAVKAIYSPPLPARFSPPTFSNVLGKGWTTTVDVCVNLTCAANAKAGTIVKLINVDYPDTLYTQNTDTTGCVHFTNVWKGNYQVQAIRFSYPVTTQTLTVLGPQSLTINLLQTPKPVTNFLVNSQSLHASWSPPRATEYQLDEPFTNFTTNGWVVNGANWVLRTTRGNPAPCAEFYYSSVVDYDMYLTSKSFAGLHAPVMQLKYDILLDNSGTTTENTMAVELWNGTAWSVLKTYTNQNDDIPWTSETINITSQTHNPAFKIRFHAHGGDCNDINWWDIDNVKILSTDGTSGPNPCVIGYNFYLNNVLSAFTTDTTYNIPPNQVEYGQTYTACVKSVFGSGYSTPVCTTFVAHFLYPARDLTATGIDCNAYLTWKKPVTMADVMVPPFDGIVEHTPSFTGLAPKNASKVPVTPPTDSPLGSIAFGTDASSSYTINFDVDNLNGMTNIAPTSSADFWCDLEMPANQTEYAYAVKDGSDHLYKVIRATGVFTDLGSMGNGSSDGFLDLAIDGSNGDIYGVTSDGSLTTDKLWKINPSVPSATLIGPCVNSAGMIGLAGDKAGNLWGYDLVNDNFYSVNKTTGLATVVGPIGFNANYGQAMFFDETTNAVTMAAYNATAGEAQIRVVDVTTGGSVLLSSSGDQIGGATLPVTTSGGGGTPKGLIGYTIYRDGAFVHEVFGPDTLSWYDYGLNPGNYKYDVMAKYDLTDYGFPGLFAESLGNTAGVQIASLECGYPLPFYEPWDNGSFAYNAWTFAPAQDHWSMNTGIGNPAPSADFHWDQAITNYSQALISPVINASAWTCATIWADFDVKLIDRNNTGKEKLTVDIFYNGTWHQKAEYVNNGSTNWIPKHVEITSVKGKAFRVRFVASGEKSEDILHWYVDNIHLYGVCNAPVDLAASQSHFTTTLTWAAPSCGGGGGTVVEYIFDDGTAENGVCISAGYLGYLGTEFPLAATTSGVLQSFKLYFQANPSVGSYQPTIEVYDAAKVLIGSVGPFTPPSDEWLTVTAPDIPFGGAFIVMVKWDNPPSLTNYLGYDESGPYAAQDLEWYYDGTAWAKLSDPAVGGGQFGPAVFMIRATALVGGDKKSVELIPGSVATGKAKASPSMFSKTDRFTDSHDYSIMTIPMNNADSSQLIGYNVYRTDSNGVGAFSKLNT
ncbi:MAG: carboxypeptidase regulatory-like domain-containing protein, partial [Bacteroidales bacterium]|nr:carboxypeptidase regulatory-like domain-containing protein [Bacteroidales bacterium]